jgi:hypothetical protein
VRRNAGHHRERVGIVDGHVIDDKAVRPAAVQDLPAVRLHAAPEQKAHGDACAPQLRARVDGVHPAFVGIPPSHLDEREAVSEDALERDSLRFGGGEKHRRRDAVWHHPRVNAALQEPAAHVAAHGRDRGPRREARPIHAVQAQGVIAVPHQERPAGGGVRAHEVREPGQRLCRLPFLGEHRDAAPLRDALPHQGGDKRRDAVRIVLHLAHSPS